MPQYMVQVTVEALVEHRDGADAISEVCTAVREGFNGVPNIEPLITDVAAVFMREEVED